MTRRVEFRPAAARNLLALDRLVQSRILAAVTRYATTGHGDIKPLRGRPGDFRLRVGKWRVFFRQDHADLMLLTGIDNRGEAY